ncbi:transcriptional regulator [Streptomyces sp. Je 1-4]|uniref:transcriptional regulator n=1 Tax=Streptomyces TaxID=1883 RepID=UPI002180C42A|nr:MULTISPECIES: transcriptional regulator [unclassified Streptomyces]UYB39251.1 transcriptional regulator [Streptomyces sp. Je 1-4]UZQ35271.1 transcriptional regulator [Streptomyces sp. Je 1-4] [Streptomyces sp. Je 1-4 4N24]UZQ42689.1 transcriptional regulator [Streptomyces sp. Je 1-4] [Streptomyces sp. Je 1-4 4N24_ara]
MYSTPFSPAEARSARARVGLSTAQVAQAMTACGTPVRPELVEAWEYGSQLPTEPQLFVLADVLWCPPTALMGVEPRTLAEHRMARQMSVERLSQLIGMDPALYWAAESAQQWSGDYRQTKALVEALGLSLRKLIGVMGRDEELAGHLRAAIDGRWKTHVGPVTKITTLSKTRVGDALRTMHAEFAEFSERYMGHVVARNDDSRLKEVAAERSAYLRRLVDHFWELIGDAGEAPPFNTVPTY